MPQNTEKLNVLQWQQVQEGKISERHTKPEAIKQMRQP